jgi:hypothetical protein
LDSPLSEDSGEFLDALPQARREVSLGQQLLAQADRLMEIPRPSPATGGAEEMDSTLLLEPQGHATLAQTLLDLSGPREAVSGGGGLLLVAE